MLFFLKEFWLPTFGRSYNSLTILTFSVSFKYVVVNFLSQVIFIFPLFQPR